MAFQETCFPKNQTVFKTVVEKRCSTAVHTLSLSPLLSVAHSKNRFWKKRFGKNIRLWKNYVAGVWGSCWVRWFFIWFDVVAYLAQNHMLKKFFHISSLHFCEWLFCPLSGMPSQVSVSRNFASAGGVPPVQHAWNAQSTGDCSWHDRDLHQQLFVNHQ